MILFGIEIDRTVRKRFIANFPIEFFESIGISLADAQPDGLGIYVRKRLIQLYLDGYLYGNGIQYLNDIYENDTGKKALFSDFWCVIREISTHLVLEYNNRAFYPNLIKIDIDNNTKGISLVIEMKKIEGFEGCLDLEKYIRQGKPANTLFPRLYTVAGNIDFMHTLKIIHRDIKPANIFLDGDLNTYLGDFGLARYGRFTLENLNEYIKGTYNYMSNEACKNDDIDKYSDLYSFGVVLLQLISKNYKSFECLINQGSMPSYSIKHLAIYANGSPRLANRDFFDQNVDQYFANTLFFRFFQKALNPDKSKRFETAEEMLSSFIKIYTETNRI